MKTGEAPPKPNADEMTVGCIATPLTYPCGSAPIDAAARRNRSACRTLRC